MKKLFSSALISASIAQPAMAVFDLSGTWNLSAGVSVSITQKADNTFEGYCYYPEAVLTALKNNATNGEKCVYGTVDPTQQTLVGKVLVFDTISDKEKCPTQSAQWTKWADLMAGYQMHANALVGVRKIFTVKEDCSQVESGNIKTITYAAPNPCVAFYAAVAGEAGLLSIPCLDVMVSGQKLSKYSVALEQQNAKDFTFNLNLDTIQKRDTFQVDRLITVK